jgi:protein-S-isoprenylcysteine O-methyltransferase Ste14
MSTVALSKTSSYDRTMQLFGGMWFMLLALGVAINIGSSADKPWPSLLSSLCLATFYVLLALLTMTRSPAKAQADGVLPRMAAFVYLAEEIAVLGVVLRNPTPLTAVLLVLHIGVQVCRILYEEDLLRRNCPEYSSYEASRWRVVPYVW